MMKDIPITQTHLEYWLGDLDLETADEEEIAEAMDYLYWLLQESEPDIDLELGVMDLVGMLYPQHSFVLHSSLPDGIQCDEWIPVKDGHPVARAIYERHYSSQANLKRRKKRKTKLFMGPGYKLPLILPRGDAGCFWRKEYFVNGGYMGVNCSLFRNESGYLSSDLILKAEEFARRYWPYEMRLFTYVNPSAVQSSNPGYCFKCAGWKCTGKSDDGLLIFEKKVTPYILERFGWGM